MKLIETTFNNFRCFKSYTLKYGGETTVLIGKNGTGKSSILSGIRRGLSFMFAKSKRYSKSLAISNNANVRSYLKEDANYDTVNRIYNYPIKNSFIASFRSSTLNWAMLKNTESGGYTTNYYKEALHAVLNAYNENLLVELPVLAVISDSFPHLKINFGSRVRKIVSQDIVPRDLAYYGWDDRTNCIELWLNRFYKVSNFEKDLNDDIKSIESQLEIHRGRF
ncbi:MAG: AAA family ATPase [Bacteroidetes bacterium]|nr:AAA family ATPase [Bacteroidota bacterium]